LSVTVKTGGRPRGRREVGMLLPRIGSKRKLVPRAVKVGSARWVQELSIVAVDEEEVEGANTELNEEGNNARPSGPAPGPVAPYTHGKRIYTGDTVIYSNRLTICCISLIKSGACDRTPDSPTLQSRKISLDLVRRSHLNLT
jgi:hypothetical protein